jgi:hypothetical protein
MEYRSDATLFGLPLVHIAMSSVVDGRFRRGVATGWIAIGDVAFGIVFASGGIAVGGVSFGGVAVGVLPIGGLALGALAIGGLALGIVSIGGAAVAWYAAVGGLAVAHTYAAGGVAIAPQIIALPVRGTPPFSAIPHADSRAAVSRGVGRASAPQSLTLASGQRAAITTFLYNVCALPAASYFAFNAL